MDSRESFEQEKKRTLSSAEQKRMDRFTGISAELEEQGYAKTELTVGIVQANVVAMAFAIPLCIVGVIAFHAVNPDTNPLITEFSELVIALGAFVGLTVVHELIHGLTWSIFAESGWRDIDFGFMKEYLTPYCTCSTPLPRTGYIVGTLMPLIMLGIIPTILGIALGSALYLWIGLVMIVSAGGDMLIVYTLLRHRSAAAEKLIYDHPTQAGCVLFER